jgi:hypothetical protein
MSREYRDDRGKLIGYKMTQTSSAPEEVLSSNSLNNEVMIARHDERLGRIESNISDIKYGNIENAKEIKELSIKVSESLNVFRDSLNEIRILKNSNEYLSRQCVENASEINKRNIELSTVKKFFVLITSVVGFISLCVGLVFSFKK